MLPKQSEIELPLLRVLVELGGSAPTQDVYSSLTLLFPDLTEEDLEERVSNGSRHWHNRIQWVRQKLITSGDMASPEKGVWAVTEQGRARIDAPAASLPAPAGTTDLLEVYEEYVSTVKQGLLQRLLDLTPTQFEAFASLLLSAYGFLDMTVTKVSGDGGIDGIGRLKVGLASMNVAVQCKKWQGNIPRTEIDKFRGAIQGEYQQGLFFTTSDFSKGAREASIKQGAVPIVLLNGESIVKLMIEKELGIRRKPLEEYQEVSIFAGEEDE